jgi:hypothetical protein
MVKIIFKIILSVLLLSYSIFIGYQYYDNNKNLNDLIKIKNSLDIDYHSSNSKIKSLEQSFTNINSEKDNIISIIKEDENNLKQINDNNC